MDVIRIAFLLVLTLFFIFFLSIFISKYILSPSNIVTFSALLSSIFFLIFKDEWSINLKFEVYLILTFSIISIMIGSIFITNIFGRKEWNSNENISYSVLSAIFFTLVNSLILVLFAFKGLVILNFSNLNLLFESIMTFKVLRNNNEEYNLGFMNYLLNFNKAIGMVYILIFIYSFDNKTYRLKYHLIIYLLPVIVTFITTLFIGQRSFILLIAVYIIFYYVNKYMDLKKNLSAKKICAIIAASLLSIFIFIYAFILLGNSYGKFIGENIISAVGLYAGGGIASFNEVYEYYSGYSSHFGEYSLRFFYELMNMFINTNFSTETLSETYTNGTGLITNVFTQNLPYYVDFGFLGVILLNLIMGITLGIIKVISKNNKNLFWDIMVFYFLYNSLFIFAGEKFYVSATVNIQFIIFFYILTKFNLIGKKSYKHVNQLK